MINGQEFDIVALVRRGYGLRVVTSSFYDVLSNILIKSMDFSKSFYFGGVRIKAWESYKKH